MGRKLPVYLVLDTSGSMMGEPIEALKNGLQILVAALKQEPMALETVWLSLITFDESARQLVPLTELVNFQTPPLEASGQTALGEALNLLADRVQVEVVKKTSPGQKGDWKPLIFLMTDGQPTDDWSKGLAKLKSATTALIIACAAGPQADTSLLKQLTENVVQLDSANRASIIQYFKWLSDSTLSNSQRTETGAGEAKSMNDLPPPPEEVRIVL